MNDYYVYGYSDPNSPDPYFLYWKGTGTPSNSTFRFMRWK
jgi:hypothetical protein